MKRLILLILVLGLIGYTVIDEKTQSRRHRPFHGSASHSRQAAQQEYEAFLEEDDDDDDHRDEDRDRREVYRALQEARRDVDAAIREAAQDVKQAMKDAAKDVRESVADVPVPIMPGSRVTEAVPVPPAPRRAPKAPRPPKPPKPMIAVAKIPAEPKIRTIAGQVSATEERAKADARRLLRAEVVSWLDLPAAKSWQPSARQVDDMIVGARITPVEKPYGTVYTAELDADFSDARRAELVHSHQQIVVRDRMLKLGGLLGFILISLAAVSGYIRADEATKGYYTRRLRLAAAAGVGAAGVLIYQMLV